MPSSLPRPLPSPIPSILLLLPLLLLCHPSHALPLSGPPLPPSLSLAPLFPASRPFLFSTSSNVSLHRYIIALYPNATSTNLTSLLTSILPANASIHQLFITPPPLLPPTPSSPSPPPTTPPPTFNAFTALLDEGQLHLVRTSPWVQYVEEDGLVSLDYDLTGTQVVREGEVGVEGLEGGRVNPFYSWGLDRIVGTVAPCMWE